MLGVGLSRDSPEADMSSMPKSGATLTKVGLVFRTCRIAISNTERANHV
jgi:hypothetical protein